MISLIMTTYNDAKYIGESIRSVLNQKLENWELIIWNDGSIDETFSIAQRFQDNRIKLFNSEHVGRTKLLIKAIKQVSIESKYIGFVDADDLLLPSTLLDCVVALEQDLSSGMVYTNYANINSDGVYLGLAKRCTMSYSKENLLRDLITFHFRLIKTEVFKQIGGIDSFFDYAEDYDLCLKISEITNVIHLQKILYLYRINPNGITQTKHSEQMKYSLIAVNNALERRGDNRLMTLKDGSFVFQEAV